jgi:hypothetical protein
MSYLNLIQVILSRVCRIQFLRKNFLSYKGLMVDTLAPKGDEGRGKLRKAAVRGTHPFTRRCPNGETHQFYWYCKLNS